MRKKSGLTIVEQAIVLVPEFENVVRKAGEVCLLLNKKCPKVLSQPKNGIAAHHAHHKSLQNIKERPFSFLLKPVKNRR